MKVFIRYLGVLVFMALLNSPVFGQDSIIYDSDWELSGEFPELPAKGWSGDREFILIKRGEFGNMIGGADTTTALAMQNVSGDEFNLAIWESIRLDTVGALVINGSDGDLVFDVGSVYIRHLALVNLKNCKVNIPAGRYDKITLKNCENVEVGIGVHLASYNGQMNFADPLAVYNDLQFKNCSFSKNLVLSIKETKGKIQFTRCHFNLDDFRIISPDSSCLLFDHPEFERIENIGNAWDDLSKLLVPTGFFFTALAAVPTFKGGIYYDDCLSAEANKLKWYKNYLVTLHQFQELYKDAYQFETGDSVFKSIKDLELQKFKYELESSRGAEKIKAGVYYYFSAFMGWFCSYGTDPLLALFNALWLILLFALLYIIFPTSLSEKVPLAENGFFFLALRSYANEETEVDKILSSFKNFLRDNPGRTFWQFYISRSRRLLVQYHKELPAGLSSLVFMLFRAKRKNNFFFMLFVRAMMLSVSIRIYLLSFIDHQLRKRITWLKANNKPVRVRTMLSAKIMSIGGVAVLFAVLARIPIGLLISINAFSTLGFGQLPLRGLTRYLAIMEGLLGWFVLTLFSITFVNILLR